MFPVYKNVLRRKILPAMSILVEWFVVYGAVRNFLTEMIGQDAACGFEHIGTEILPLQLGRTAAFQQTHEHILNHVLQVTEIACPAAEIGQQRRSEEHTSALQSLVRISYAVFCL